MRGEGDLIACLVIDINKNNDGYLTLSHPCLAETIIKSLNLENDCKVHDTPECYMLTSNKDGDSFSEDWHHRSLQGMLKCLVGSTRPDAQFAAHQTSRFCNNPMASHDKAIKRIGRCLKRAKDKGVIFSPNTCHSFEYWEDADFAGSWNLKDSIFLCSALSRSRLITKH